MCASKPLLLLQQPSAWTLHKSVYGHSNTNDNSWLRGLPQAGVGQNHPTAFHGGMAFWWNNGWTWCLFYVDSGHSVITCQMN
ncbi:hypothetical protein EG68_11235 [Paragonimus skrjabini miyazakii]|uniref:Uncharacterized protein n=1 Tax=Paragonimus skrjabini miyazakii TaxID=59628 RepID=A0A8S9YA58_9TREM|nr:hypothetical protein EG68_11235 [Paragonimus skrjabini miyazakii]